MVGLPAVVTVKGIVVKIAGDGTSSISGVQVKARIRSKDEDRAGPFDAITCCDQNGTFSISEEVSYPDSLRLIFTNRNYRFKDILIDVASQTIEQHVSVIVQALE
jgi:hypothetical protein